MPELFVPKLADVEPSQTPISKLVQIQELPRAGPVHEGGQLRTDT